MLFQTLRQFSRFAVFTDKELQSLVVEGGKSPCIVVLSSFARVIQRRCQRLRNLALPGFW